MMLEQLKQAVLAANLELPKLGLVDFTWGNVSGKDAETGAIVIKPSGVPYETMKTEDMVVVDRDGKIIEGKLRPSSDLATQRSFRDARSAAHPARATLGILLVAYTADIPDRKSVV